MTILMMGSKGEDVDLRPAEPVKFIEDMTESDLMTEVNYSHYSLFHINWGTLKKGEGV